jgi:hypothetical protein
VLDSTSSAHSASCAAADAAAAAGPAAVAATGADAASPCCCCCCCLSPRPPLPRLRPLPLPRGRLPPLPLLSSSLGPPASGICALHGIQPASQLVICSRINPSTESLLSVSQPQMPPPLLASRPSFNPPPPPDPYSHVKLHPASARQFVYPPSPPPPRGLLNKSRACCACGLPCTCLQIDPRPPPQRSRT